MVYNLLLINRRDLPHALENLRMETNYQCTIRYKFTCKIEVCHFYDGYKFIFWTIQGTLYKDGTQFDSSVTRGSFDFSELLTNVVLYAIVVFFFMSSPTSLLILDQLD
jgi:hypothetical protein